MNPIVSERNIYPDERYEALFAELFERFDETGHPRQYGQVDALLVSEEGNGHWGVVVNDDGELGIWMLADAGTITFYANGSVDFNEVDLEDDYTIKPDEHIYDHAYRVMENFIPVDDMPEKIPGDDVEEEAEELSHKADVEEDEDSEDE